MTWQELKEKAKEMGYIYDDGSLMKDGWSFDVDGDIWFFGNLLTKERTYKKMLMIMRGLE